LYNNLRELLTVIISVTANLPKSHRYVIGARMQELAIDLGRLFAEAYTANSVRSVELMNTFMADFHTLGVLVTLSIDNKWIYGRNKAAHLIKLMAQVEKQATALRNSYERRSSCEKRSQDGHGSPEHASS
jgi:hypothetical protein